MTSGGSGAVFFLGTRAHYQVLQQPEARSFDTENGNASTETIYQNPSSEEIWPKNAQTDVDTNYISERNWNYCEGDVIATDERHKEIGNVVKRRTKSKRCTSETTLCERDDMRPAVLNKLADSSTPKSKARRRISPLTFLASLARRKRKLEKDQVQYLKHLENTLTTCTYRESCRCLECQSRYFECDESEGYSSDDDSDYTPHYVTVPEPEPSPQPDDDDDEVFVDTVPDDNTSTDMLIEGKEKMSVSSDSILEDDEDNMQFEVAAGTPVLLNYLLTHPISCAIQ